MSVPSSRTGPRRVCNLDAWCSAHEAPLSEMLAKASHYLCRLNVARNFSKRLIDDRVISTPHIKLHPLEHIGEFFRGFVLGADANNVRCHF